MTYGMVPYTTLFMNTNTLMTTPTCSNPRCAKALAKAEKTCRSCGKWQGPPSPHPVSGRNQVCILAQGARFVTDDQEMLLTNETSADGNRRAVRLSDGQMFWLYPDTWVRVLAV